MTGHAQCEIPEYIIKVHTKNEIRSTQKEINTI